MERTQRYGRLYKERSKENSRKQRKGIKEREN